MRKPHLHIGIIGHCDSFARPLISGLIHGEIAKKFPGQDVKMTWVEPDNEELLSKLFPKETEMVEYEIRKIPHNMEGTFPSIVAQTNTSIRSNFDFRKRHKEGFCSDLKSVRLKAKHRRA